MSSAAFSPIQRTSGPPIPWYWKLFAVVAGLLDPVKGILAGAPGWFMGVGRTDRWDTPRRRKRGLVVVLGGIEGPSIHQRRMGAGLIRGGWRGAIVVHSWNRGAPFLRMLRNLGNREHHERESDQVVAMIHEQRRQFPGSPIGILSQSGGCWIAIRALEKLPSTVQIRSAVMLAPCISPRHDFSLAASRCECGLACVGGPGDWMLLGLGTLLAGTSDRYWCTSCGWLGWHGNPTGCVEVRWRPEWLRHGYLGNHTSSGVPRFVAACIAPWFCRGYSSTSHFAPSKE